MSNQCLCGNEKAYEQCCGRFHLRHAYPKTPEQLMRSRFCAYAMGGLGQFLLDTWHPVTALGLTSTGLSELTYRWVRLEILNKSQKGDNGTVEFNAFYLNDNNNEDVLHEKSCFERIGGKWLYVSAENDH